MVIKRWATVYIKKVTVAAIKTMRTVCPQLEKPPFSPPLKSLLLSIPLSLFSWLTPFYHYTESPHIKQGKSESPQAFSVLPIFLRFSIIFLSNKVPRTLQLSYYKIPHFRTGQKLFPFLSGEDILGSAPQRQDLFHCIFYSFCRLLLPQRNFQQHCCG